MSAAASWLFYFEERSLMYSMRIEDHMRFLVTIIRIIMRRNRG